MTFALTGLGPISNPQAWDVVYIGGVASPGVVKVSGFKRPHEWDIKKGKGVYGSVITYTGHPPARGTLTFELWTDSQIETEWPEFSALFQYDPTKAQVTGVGISYPSLNQIGITSVVCENIGAIEHKGAQLYEVAVDLIEWFPPPPTRG
jgi:hypothetical protein